MSDNVHTSKRVIDVAHPESSPPCNHVQRFLVSAAYDNCPLADSHFLDHPRSEEVWTTAEFLECLFCLASVMRHVQMRLSHWVIPFCSAGFVVVTIRFPPLDMLEYEVRAVSFVADPNEDLLRPLVYFSHDAYLVN